MCCILAIGALIGPRIAILVWWLLDPVRWGLAFSGVAGVAGGWLVGALGSLFLPWTTLAFVLLAPAPMQGIGPILLVLALVADLSSYGGGYRSRPVRAA